MQTIENKSLKYNLQTAEDITVTDIVRSLADLDVVKRTVIQGALTAERNNKLTEEDPSLWHDLWEGMIYTDESREYHSERCKFWSTALVNLLHQSENIIYEHETMTLENFTGHLQRISNK